MSTVYLGSRPASAARAGLLAATAALPPIGLAELLERAGLDERTELTYVLPSSALPALFRQLPSELRVLEIDGRRMFGYESVYFDTPDRLCFRQHLQRNRHRFKVRTRTYLDSGGCMVEVKMTGPRSTTVKHRRPYPIEQRERLDEEARRFIADHLTTPAARLDPVLITAYHRLTLVDLAAGARLTCDADLLCRAGDRSAEILADRVILETKSATARSGFEHALHRAGLRAVPLSKYCAAVVLLGDGVRANPWHRILHHQPGPRPASHLLAWCRELTPGG